MENIENGLKSKTFEPETINPKKFAAMIGKIRINKGWSLEEMGFKVSLSGMGYKKIEDGKTRLSLERINEIATAFGYGVFKLLEFYKIEEALNHIKEMDTAQRMKLLDKMVEFGFSE